MWRPFGSRALVLGIAFALTGCSAVAQSSAPSPTPSIRYTPIPTATPTPGAAATAKAAATPNWDALPVAANDPVALGQQLAMVETALRDPALTGAHLDWMGHLQQLAYSRLQDYPEWKESVF